MQQRSRQLLRYLDETEGIEGPGRDLVHAQGMDSGLPQALADRLVLVSMSGNGEGIDRLVEEIRAEAREAAQMGGRTPEDAVRMADQEILHLLSRRARSRGTDESGKAIHVLLDAVPVCADSLDKLSATRVLARIELYLRHAGDLDDSERAALAALRQRSEAASTEGPPTALATGKAMT
jgi:hypothetical protein